MADRTSKDILLTCRSIAYRDGYPVLDRVFRHLARTPEEFVVWVETETAGIVHLFVQFSDGYVRHIGDWEIPSSREDYMKVEVPTPNYEGAAEIVMVDGQTGNERASRSVHFGGLS